MACERLDRAVERAGPVVGDEREGRPPGFALMVDPRMRGDRDETREGFGVVAHVMLDHLQAVDRGGPLAGDRGFPGRVRLGDLRGGIGSRGGRDRADPVQPPQQLPALLERDGVGANDADLALRERPAGDEMVADRNGRLGDDRERRVVEQVVRLGDGPGQRVLDR